MTATIQLALGVNEEASDVRLTRSKDGSTSTATFIFENPLCMTEGQVNNEITGMYMSDEEGEMVTRSVNAKFINGQPAGIEAIYRMDGEAEWERFLRFMNRYAEANGMDFNKS
ncbi:Photosystem II reaction center Psb28 protein [Thalassoporum mexicanum PCC 7367]|uniref:photosystem II reaction center protein Psb28 n=1 Tax=Thalassoporum mexicanum TaxID=3457544 RepID=UPI00029FC1DD|nr:photosystem II reaction center protein Psb28 [Pseudanabaena sp. PCC 7367]AFY70946.1 Photosystem II reaction center Psb28 protein [Pseudanabaena sp. PCC 7367]